jgi:hypothetical protein
MEGRDLIVPAFREGGVVSGPERRGGATIAFFGEGDHETLRSNFDGGNAVI